MWTFRFRFLLVAAVAIALLFGGACAEPHLKEVVGGDESPKGGPGDEDPGGGDATWRCDAAAIEEPEGGRSACEAKEGWRWVLTPGAWECVPPRPPTPLTEAECRALGGFANLGFLDDDPYTTCSLPTSDEGKPCCGSEACEGKCETEESRRVPRGTKVEGTCSFWSIPDCWSRVEDGLSGGRICY